MEVVDQEAREALLDIAGSVTAAMEKLTDLARTEGRLNDKAHKAFVSALGTITTGQAEVNRTLAEALDVLIPEVIRQGEEIEALKAKLGLGDD